MLTFERQIGCPNQLRSAPGSDDVTLRHCCWQTGFCAASPQCTQVLKWHAADHFGLWWAGLHLGLGIRVAYRLSPPSPCATSRHAALVGSCLAAASVFCRATASARQRLGSVGVFNPTLHTILHTSDTYDTIDTCIYTYDMIIETCNLYIYNVKPLSYPGFKS